MPDTNQGKGMAKTIKQALSLEAIRKFGRLGDAKRAEILQDFLAGKVVNDANGGDRVLNFNGVIVIIRHTGGKPIIVKVIGLDHPLPQDPDRPEYKGALDRLLKDGYELKRAATTDSVLLELIDKKDRNLRVTIMA